MNEAIENIKEWTGLVENVIFNDEACPSSFEKRFCYEEQLIDVWFGSERFQVVFLASSGEHIQKTYTYEELEEWLEADDRWIR